MYNPYEEFEKSDQPLSTQVTERLGAEAAQSQETINTMQEAEKQQLAPTGQPVQQKQQQPTPTSTPAEQKKTEEPTSLLDNAQYYAESGVAIPTGALDFGVDIINLIPGVNAPKLPKFKNELAQAAREISSFLLQTVGVRRGFGD